MNGQETDVDCGGPLCPPCAVNQNCICLGDCNNERYTMGDTIIQFWDSAGISYDSVVTPFIGGNPGVKRTQYLFLAEEIDLITCSQNNPNNVQGWYPNDFTLGVTFRISGFQGTNNTAMGGVLQARLKHSSLSAFSSDFDNTNDPAAACGQYSPLGGNNGPVFSIYDSLPDAHVNIGGFEWNGVDNVILEIIQQMGTQGVAGVWVNSPDTFNSVISAFDTTISSACAMPISGTSCPPSTFPIPGANMSTSSCVNWGVSNVRPITVWRGDVGRIVDYTLFCCNGVCTDFLNDSNNCGECGVVCPPGQTCSNGSCQ